MVADIDDIGDDDDNGGDDACGGGTVTTRTCFTQISIIQNNWQGVGTGHDSRFPDATTTNTTFSLSTVVSIIIVGNDMAKMYAHL